MLVTLGSGEEIGAGASQTFQYSCNSVSSVLVRTEDAGDSLDGYLTVQIGNEVVVNDIKFNCLQLYGGITGGADELTSNSSGFEVRLGSHVLDAMENLYVTIRNGDTANAMSAIDVSAIVNESGLYSPIKYTNYSDSVFTDTNTLAIYAWASTTDLDEDNSAFTVRNEAYSSAPQILSGVSVTYANCWGFTNWKRIATMAKNQVPMNTSVNYTSSNPDGVLCISAMDRQPSKQAEATRTGRNLVRSMSPSEAKAL